MPRPNLMLAGFVACSTILIAAIPSGAAADRSETELWQALASGQAVALLRHASAPSFGDPPDFDMDDCSTQRNLSAAGRAETARIGDAFRANGIERAVVRSSQRVHRESRRAGSADADRQKVDTGRGQRAATSIRDTSGQYHRVVRAVDGIRRMGRRPRGGWRATDARHHCVAGLANTTRSRFSGPGVQILALSQPQEFVAT